MATVLIVGPVIRGGKTRYPWADMIYEQLRDVPSIALKFPYSETALEESAPRMFYSAYTRMMERADGVISVLPGGDASGPVEALMAEMLSKRQLIIAERPMELPRLIQGLPQARVTDGKNVYQEALGFLSSLSIGPIG